MDKAMKIISLHFFILSIILFPLLATAQEDQDMIREEVRVVNVEVPVRVVYKGKPVANLKRSDFKLYESGKE
ncbi:MAG: hypothetical protein KAS65_01995 [Candidatus Aminicenantes bacterium]|nr:hypothetical protein [Candidatus Aminicenantes bacterium]